jgi:hypothetical protein
VLGFARPVWEEGPAHRQGQGRASVVRLNLRTRGAPGDDHLRSHCADRLDGGPTESVWAAWREPTERAVGQRRGPKRISVRPSLRPRTAALRQQLGCTECQGGQRRQFRIAWATAVGTMRPD